MHRKQEKQGEKRMLTYHHGRELPILHHGMQYRVGLKTQQNILFYPNAVIYVSYVRT